MKKVVAVFVLLAICLIFVSGCTKNKSESEVTEDKPSMFVLIEEGSHWKVYYHRDTKVMYVMSHSSDNRGNFTVMVNPDGSPMLYKNTKED